jgi:hypothetical protein
MSKAVPDKNDRPDQRPCAVSRNGCQISLVVTGDTTAFPDLDVLMEGMERDWHALVEARGAQPIAGGMQAAGVPTVGW